MSHCSDCGRNLSESGGGDCETCSGVCEPKEPTLADVDVIEVINTLPTMTEFECGYNECAGRLQAVIESEQPGKPLAKRLQEIIELPMLTDFDRRYQACAKMVLGSVEGAAAQQTIDSQAFEAYQNQYYQNNLRQ